MCGGGGIGGILGGLAGFVLGGPVGALVGFSAGATAGSMLDQPKQQTPQINIPQVQPPKATQARREADTAIRSTRERAAAASGTPSTMRGTLLTGPGGVADASLNQGKAALKNKLGQ